MMRQRLQTGFKPLGSGLPHPRAWFYCEGYIMADWNPAANEIFLNAVEIGSPEKRRAYLESACARNADLRRAVDAPLQRKKSYPGQRHILDQAAAIHRA